MEGNPDLQGEPAQTTLENQNPAFIVDQYNNVTDFLAAYGWFLLLGVGLIFYLKHRFSPQLEKMKRRYEERAERANYDENKVRQREEAMEAARRRMQETHNAKAERFAEEQKQKEEEKRQKRIEDWDRHQEGKGYRSKYKPENQPSTSSGSQQSQPKKKTVYRSSDYNPLMGGGGGAGYRPSRRMGGGGGG